MFYVNCNTTKHYLNVFKLVSSSKQNSFLYLLQIDSYVKIFPKVAHGWTVRYNVEDAEAVKAAEESHENMLEWFVKYVK